MTTKTKSSLYKAIESAKYRSAWDKGVNLYALELVEFLEENDLEPTRENMLNGAANWHDASWGGSSLIYNSDIAERLCTPSGLKRTNGGDSRPNSQEEWLDTQGRALSQACRHVLIFARRVEA